MSATPMRLRVRDVLGVASAEVALSGLTLIVGLNGSGKSSPPNAAPPPPSARCCQATLRWRGTSQHGRRARAMGDPAIKAALKEATWTMAQPHPGNAQQHVAAALLRALAGIADAR